MKKFLGLTLMIAGLMIQGCSESNTSPKDQQLIVGVSADYPPFESSLDGQLQGFDIDLARALGEKLNKTVVFKEMDFTSIISSLQSGRIHLGISGVARNAEREKVVDFSIPYYQTKFALVSRQDAPMTALREAKEHKIGAQLGSTMENLLKSHQAEYGYLIHTLNSNATLIQELKTKRIEGVVLEAAQAKAFCEAHQDLLFHTIEAQATGEFSVALAKDSPLRATIDIVITQMKSDGFLKSLEDKWLNPKAD